MKKFLFTMMILCCSIAAAIAQPNISTGFSNTANGQTDPNWKVTPVGLQAITVASYGAYWQATPIAGTGARWINPTAAVGTQVPGVYTYERNVPITAGIKAVTFSFSIAYDDDLTSVEIVDAGGNVDNLTSLVVRGTSPAPYSLSNEITRTYSCPKFKMQGDWKIRVKVKYVDALGAFILSGNVKTEQGVCCDCPIPNTNVNFSICSTLGGGTTATASAMGASTGLGNGWTLKQVACPSTNPCKWLAGGIKWQSVGSSITIPSSVLTPGCYVLTHYVNRCSKQWDPKQCLSYRSICFTICDNGITTAQDVNPKMAMRKMGAENENVELDEVEREAEVISGKN